MPFRVNDRTSHLRVLMRIALLVAAGDWLTKAVAARLVGNEPIVFTDRLRFAVVHNDGTAFGLSAGVYTWQLNLALTIFAILLMVPVARDLSRIDEAAPRALGLIVGGALGNLASIAITPPGVVDFISVAIGAHSELVVNFADIAAYVGLAMLVRTGFLIVSEMRRITRPTRAAPVAHWVTMAKRVGSYVEREVPRPVALADVRPETEVSVSLVVPRPESVRRTELADLAIEATDPKVIDIRPHLAMARSDARAQRSEGLNAD